MTQRVGLIGLGAIGRAVVRITRERFPTEMTSWARWYAIPPGRDPMA